jgi:hypothetical protein
VRQCGITMGILTPSHIAETSLVHGVFASWESMLSCDQNEVHSNSYCSIFMYHYNLVTEVTHLFHCTYTDLICASPLCTIV